MENLTFNELPQAVTQLFDKLEKIELLLVLKNNPLPFDEDQIFTIKEASDFLKLSVPTIYGYVHRTAIPFSKGAKRLYFSKKDLIEWIKQGKQRTLAEIEAEAKAYLSTKKRG
jgi:excisionase family DNA binding protein